MFKNSNGSERQLRWKHCLSRPQSFPSLLHTLPAGWRQEASPSAGTALLPRRLVVVLRQPLAADVPHDRVLGLLRRTQHLLHQRPGPARVQFDRLKVGGSQLVAKQVGFDLHTDGQTVRFEPQKVWRVWWSVSGCSGFLCVSTDLQASDVSVKKREKHQTPSGVKCVGASVLLGFILSRLSSYFKWDRKYRRAHNVVPFTAAGVLGFMKNIFRCHIHSQAKATRGKKNTRKVQETKNHSHHQRFLDVVNVFFFPMKKCCEKNQNNIHYILDCSSSSD